MEAVTTGNARVDGPKGKKVWIDLDNSPHVPLFKPIIKELEKKGYTVFLTARDCSQTCGLADLYHFQYKRIGKHFGKNKLLKVVGLLLRSFQLAPTIIKERPSIALSHGSRAQSLLSGLLGIPAILMYDYEHAKVIIRPDWAIIPEVIPDHAEWGKTRFLHYSGIKEDAYVPDFRPDPGILRALGINDSDIVVTIRPPAFDAHYHNRESEPLFFETVDSLAAYGDVRIVMLPRNVKQADFVRTKWPELLSNRKVIIPEGVLDGLDLIWYSDLVISGGGTMNREAAALGVPVYSIFRGKLGAVDRYLAETGRLTMLETVEDVRSKIRLIRREKVKEINIGDSVVLNQIVSAIELALGNA